MHLKHWFARCLFVPCWSILIASSACAPEPDPSVLLTADRQFSEEVAQGGSEAWVSWFASDGAMVQPNIGEIRGHDAVRNFVRYLDDPNVALTWEPSRADISRSGDLGWTTGTYTFHSTANGVETEGRGIYVSIWRLQEDGHWKVVMDLGNPT